jgi:glycosyltransferase involved in cell wall biosynthesis
MNSTPLVSVLMTSYNREKYISEAIESVLASTFRDLELIITDDGSRDGTVAIARSYADKDKRVRVFINEKNLGDYPNRNHAASLARGKYLKYVDSDDYLYPTGLETLVSMMEQFPEAGWGLCSLLQIVERPYPFQLHPREAYEHHYFGPGLFHKAPLSSIFLRSAFEKAGGFAPMRMVGDSEMWHRMALQFPVVLMPDGVAWYREHDGQEVAARRQFVLDYERVTLNYLRNSSCPLTKEQVGRVIAKKKRKALQYAFLLLLRFRFDDMIDNLKVWKFYLYN